MSGEFQVHRSGVVASEPPKRIFTLEWTAAVRHPDGSLEPVGVSHCDDVNPRAQADVMEHVYAWRRDAPDKDVVLLRRSVGRWVVCREQ